MGLDLSGVTWQRSTHSAAERSVEVAFVGDAIVVRLSDVPDGPVLVFTPSEWDAFVDGAKDGEFDLR